MGFYDAMRSYAEHMGSLERALVSTRKLDARHGPDILEDVEQSASSPSVHMYLLMSTCNSKG